MIIKFLFLNLQYRLFMMRGVVQSTITYRLKTYCDFYNLNGYIPKEQNCSEFFSFLRLVSLNNYSLGLTFPSKWFNYSKVDFVFLKGRSKLITVIDYICEIINTNKINSLGQTLTTSMICIRVKPKLSWSGSVSFSTGRSKVLYLSSKWCSKRFSLGPWIEPTNNKERETINKNITN